MKKEKAETKSKISLDILKGKSIVEVSEMSSTEVVVAIEAIAIRIANQVLMKKGFSKSEMEPGTTQKIITLTGTTPESVSMCRGIIEEMV